MDGSVSVKMGKRKQKVEGCLANQYPSIGQEQGRVAQGPPPPVQVPTRQLVVLSHTQCQIPPLHPRLFVGLRGVS